MLSGHPIPDFVNKLVFITFTLLIRLSPRLWSMTVGTCSHLASRALMSSGADVGHRGLVHSSGVQWG